MMMLVPLHWRFFTGFNVLRSEQEKDRDLYHYWIKVVTDEVERGTRSILRMTDVIEVVADTIATCAVRMNKMQRNGE